MHVFILKFIKHSVYKNHAIYYSYNNYKNKHVCTYLKYSNPAWFRITSSLNIKVLLHSQNVHSHKFIGDERNTFFSNIMIIINYN